jgi:hypothetical protein
VIWSLIYDYKILTPRFTNFDSAFYKFWLRVLQILTPRFTNFDSAFYKFWLRVLQIFDSAFYKSTPLRVLQIHSTPRFTTCQIVSSLNSPGARLQSRSTRSWVRNQAAPQNCLKILRCASAPAQVLHEKVERAERVRGTLCTLIKWVNWLRYTAYTPELYLNIFSSVALHIRASLIYLQLINNSWAN